MAMDNYLDFRKESDYDKLKKPAEILKQGGIVIFPTETVYGIGANGLNEDAIPKIYEAKRICRCSNSKGRSRTY